MCKTFSKRKIYHCKFVVSGYHVNEITNINRLRDVGYVVGHETSEKPFIWGYFLCVLFVVDGVERLSRRIIR
jgi:hypothetical protein